ncbi:SLC13 family permease [Dasania marina]|uniref:SLC13 family permease n=1 Tax=Dasania marina TaxID=471499 RepID=UPI0030D9C81D
MIVIRNVLLWLGPLVALVLYGVLVSLGFSGQIAITAAVAVLCVLWWIFEPIPIPVTSLLPLAVFQLTGVLDKNEVAQAYGSPLILLLLGGFMLSKAMESSGAHRRMALAMVRLCGGGSSRQLLLGFMLASALLSMWISNTATTLMLLPVAIAVLEKSEDKQLALPLMLGVAYAASIGGLGTPIGTPPNLVFMQVYEQHTGETITFSQWMGWGLPVVVLMIPLAAWWLGRSLQYKGGFHIEAVGRWTVAERRVLTIFALTALAWITRQEPFGGWSHWLNVPQADDASVALVAVVLMFMLPGGKNQQGETPRLLDWQTAASIPWGILLLFGGGICLAKAFLVSGLSGMLGEGLTGLAYWPLWLMVITISLSVTFLTECTSNTASTVLLMPVLAAAGIAAGIDIKLLMVPAAMSASCAFMLPVATAPNSIVYGSGYVTTRQMVREGVVLNVIGAGVISTVCYFLLV